MNVVVLGLAQVGPKALPRVGGEKGGGDPQGHGDQGHEHHQSAPPQNVAGVAGGDAGVHDVRHHQGEQQLEHRLAGGAEHPQGDPLPVPPGVWP